MLVVDRVDMQKIYGQLCDEFITNVENFSFLITFVITLSIDLNLILEKQLYKHS